MKLDMLAIDIGKRSFQIHGIDADGCIVSRKISRGKLAISVEQLDPQIVFMEACGSSHHWGRLFQASGREVRLVNPYFVRPFVRGSKNDAADAEAIWDAATRPSMRFVPVKTLDQQDLQSLHRMRDRLVRARTSLINHSRGLLAEYGIVLPKGAARFSKAVPEAVASADLSALTRSTRRSGPAHREDRHQARGDLEGTPGLSSAGDHARRWTCHRDGARCGYRQRSALPFRP
jgi:transposase